MDDSPDFPWKVTRQKTAALLRASILSGAILAGGDEESLAALGTFGDHLGFAFQIVDDILDVTSTAEELGKTPGKDESQNKKTFVAVYGLQKARELAAGESRLASAALEGVRGETAFFSDLSDYLCERTK
jgi:geranylgeranyl diphosphate synthase type II